MKKRPRSAKYRNLPHNISVPSPKTFQVRFARDGEEYSSCFSWRDFGGKEGALAEAVRWRNEMLAIFGEKAAD